jgi:hypothetical protein
MLYCLQYNDKFHDLRVKVANIIHKLFHSIKLDAPMIKSKIRKRLIELNYLHNGNELFIDEDKFYSDFSEYNMLSVDTYDLLHILNFTKNNVTPLAYITIILFLFGTMEEFIKYK